MAASYRGERQREKMKAVYQEKEITVGELIDILQKMPPSASVTLEGCDCYGKATGAEYRSDSYGDYAFIYREDGVDSDERQGWRQEQKDSVSNEPS